MDSVVSLTAGNLAHDGRVFDVCMHTLVTAPSKFVVVVDHRFV